MHAALGRAGSREAWKNGTRLVQKPHLGMSDVMLFFVFGLYISYDLYITDVIGFLLLAQFLPCPLYSAVLKMFHRS